MRARAGRLALVALLGLGLVGCGGTGLSLGRRAVSVCYRSLPAAAAAVNDPAAHLVGVHRMTLAVLHRRDSFLLSTWPVDRRPVCAVALKGPFAAGQVTGAPPGRSGRFAVVVVDERTGRILGATVADRLPRRLLGRSY